ncbi:unnamed protein product [Cuscuta campestris]|uniref:Uncharacterized protein n=1 Tax=Cuscuta campestris TaxID=132261 RepID=A0A484MLW2_9ASTE|nr:unnamed protein product [Cuscuta campestris]
MYEEDGKSGTHQLVKGRDRSIDITAVAVSLAEEISTETQVTASRTHTALRFRRILRVSDKSQGSQHSALSAAVESQFAALRPVVHRFRRNSFLEWREYNLN